MSEIDELDVHCREVVAPPLRGTRAAPRMVSSSCSERLGRYFASVPFRGGAALRHAGRREAGGRGALNERADHLPYTRADRMLGDQPAWGDVFDGGIEDRLDVVHRVVADPACVALNDGGGIRLALRERCEARELFLYAAYLDACSAGIPFFMLHGPRMRDGASLYESVYESLREREDEDEDETASGWWIVDLLGEWGLLPGGEEETTGRRRLGDGGSVKPSLAETSLLAAWVAEQCSSLRFIPFDSDLRPNYQAVGMNAPDEIVEAMKPGHDAALSIAARAGDPWAVQVFYAEGLAADVEYWKSLRDFNPLLFHRWMATDVGAEMGLGPWDRALHALKAFAVERRTSSDLELDSYLALYDLSREWLDPSWRDGSRLRDDTSALDESLAYPWDAAR